MKKITIILTVFIIGQSLCMEQKDKPQEFLARDYYRKNSYCDSGEVIFKATIARSNYAEFKNLMMIAGPNDIPDLQTMKQWSEQAEAITEQAVKNNKFMDYRRQEHGQVLLQESTMHPEDPVACVGCLSCIGSMVATYLVTGPLSLIPTFLMCGSIGLVQYSVQNRIKDAQGLAQLRDAQSNQASIQYDLQGMIEMKKRRDEDQEIDQRLSQLSIAQDNDTSASMDEEN